MSDKCATYLDTKVTIYYMAKYLILGGDGREVLEAYSVEHGVYLGPHVVRDVQDGEGRGGGEGVRADFRQLLLDSLQWRCRVCK